MTKNKKLLGIVLGSLILLLAITCGPVITIPVVTKFPSRNFVQMMKGKKKVAIILKKTDKNWLQQAGYQEDWTKTVQGAVENSFNAFRYFTLIDISSRKERLSEIAYSQSGMTKEMKQVGQEFGTDAFLKIELTNQPRQECTVENRIDKVAAAMTVVSLATSKGKDSGGQQISKPTGIRVVTVFVKATLVNIETGQMISFTASKPYKHENSVGNQECPSVLEAFNGALEQAAHQIAEKLSPRVEDIEVSIEDGVDDVSKTQQKSVGALIKMGNKWVKTNPPNFDEAEKSWKEALEMSGNKSVSCYWNLAVYKWYKGDMSGAKEYFEKAKKLGGPDWLGSSRMDVYAKFNADKKRLDQEAEAKDN